MSLTEQILTIAICVAGTMLTRFLPFLVFREGGETPPLVTYLGRALPAAIFGMLVVYSLKGVQWTVATESAPALLAVAATVALHLWRRNMLLSIAGGTLCYMILIQLVF